MQLNDKRIIWVSVSKGPRGQFIAVCELPQGRRAAYGNTEVQAFCKLRADLPKCYEAIFDRA